MSSDTDELDGYEPSTPYQLSKRRRVGTSNPASAAGPSSSTSTSTATAKGQKAAKTKQRKASRETPVIVEDDDDEVVPEVVLPNTRSKGKSKAPTPSPATNGKPPSRTKGKGKAAPTSNGYKNGTDLVVIEELDDDEDEPHEANKTPSPTKKGKGKTRAGPPIPVEDGEIVEEVEIGPSRELERIKEERDLYKTKSEGLSESLLQLIRTRNTEPEEQLAALKAQYDAAAQAQEELIKELTTQIARLTPMIEQGQGRSSTLHFLTREAADEEKRMLEERLSNADDALKRKDAIIKDKDSRLAALNEQLETTQADLKAEIAHAQSLRNKQREPPGSSSQALRGRAAAAQDALVSDPKHGVTIRLYEDLTNLIVLSAKMQDSPHAHLGELEEITYKCIFSHMNTTSLSFLLTSMHQPKPSAFPDRSPLRPKSKDDLQHMVRYTPLELDKESQEYIQKLDFLADTFTFGYDQMECFLKTLNDHFSSLTEEQDDSAMMEG